MKGVNHPESGPNPAQQQHVDSTDVNRMSDKYLKSRLVGNPNGRKPMFIDVPSDSFHDMMNKVSRIQQDFVKLPARLRSRFLNSPGVLLAFVDNPDNRREAVGLGLIHDPELLYQIESERAAKRAPKVQQTELNPLPLKADLEAQPEYKGGKPPKTPSIP